MNPTQIKPVTDHALTVSGLLLEAYKEMRHALRSHTEALGGYTASTQRDRALATAADHIDQAQRMIREAARS